MDNNGDVLGRVRKAVAEQLRIPDSEVTAESRLVADLGTDSLDMLELGMAVEDEFGLESTPDEAWAKVVTVGDAVDVVGRLLGERDARQGVFERVQVAVVTQLQRGDAWSVKSDSRLVEDLLMDPIRLVFITNALEREFELGEVEEGQWEAAQTVDDLVQIVVEHGGKGTGPVLTKDARWRAHALLGEAGWFMVRQGATGSAKADAPRAKIVVTGEGAEALATRVAELLNG